MTLGKLTEVPLLAVVILLLSDCLSTVTVLYRSIPEHSIYFWITPWQTLIYICIASSRINLEGKSEKKQESRSKAGIKPPSKFPMFLPVLMKPTGSCLYEPLLSILSVKEAMNEYILKYYKVTMAIA